MNTPKIRFKGFKDDWEQRKLDTVAKFSKGSGYSKGDLIETGTPIILYGRLYTKYETSISDVDTYAEAKEGSVYSKGGEVIVPASGETAEDIARAATVDKSGILLGGDLNVVMPNEDINSAFLAISISNGNSQRELAKKAQGKSVVHIHNEEIRNLIVPFPIKAEQNRIVDYFSTLDHLITLHQRKCDETKQLKKFMLQKMFPKNGEKNPEIRFEGFTDDWEQRKFSDCYKMSSGYAFKMSDYCDEGVGLINGESIQHGIINDDNLNHLPEFFIQQYPEFLLKENDIVVGLNRPITNGNLKIARIPSKYNDSLLYQRAGKIVYKTDCDKDFTYVLLSQEILKHTLVEAVGSDQPFISTSKLDGWKMMMPSNMEEQVKIGEYFQNLDDLITLHQRKCEKLKELKKFMLQNMFV